MAQGDKSTLTGGKRYTEPGLPDGTVDGINKAAPYPSETYRAGTSGSPDDQGGPSPFGKATA